MQEFFMILSVMQQRFIWPSLLACVLATGCGGGGSDSNTATAPVTTPVTTPFVTTPVTTPAVSVAVDLGSTVISGVVSTGAPVMGGILRVIDATGLQV